MASNSKKILVTGSNGMIGQELCKQLVARGDHVTGIDNGWRKTNAQKIAHTTITCDVQDLKDSNIVDWDRFDQVYHLAAINGTTNFYDYPHTVIENNINSDLSVFKYVKSRLIWTSTSEIVAGDEQIPTSENVDVSIKNIHNPRWSYRIGKMVSENWLANSKLDHAVIRFFNVWSENDAPGHFISDQIAKMKQGKFELMNPSDTRSFCYVEDAVDAMIHVADSQHQGVVNIGSQEEISIMLAAELLAETLGYSRAFTVVEGHSGSTSRRCPDITKLLEIYPEFNPKTFEQMVKEKIKNV
jgi:nucleoside-diphosphate-sugar epimerase